MLPNHFRSQSSLMRVALSRITQHRRPSFIISTTLTRNFAKMQDNLKRGPDFRSDEIHTRIDHVGKTVSLTFQLLNEFHTMNRSYDETMDRSLQRFAITCRSKLQKDAKKASKAAKKNKNEAKEESEQNQPKPAVLLLEGVECDASTRKNFDIKTGMQVLLDNLNFTFVTNPPTVLALTTYPRSVVYVGCPIVPQVSIEFGDDYECMWAVESSPKSGDFEIVSHEKVFTPAASALDCRVKVFCHAVQSTTDASSRDHVGRSVVFYLAGTVQPAPETAEGFNRLLGVRQGFNSLRRANQPRSSTGFDYLDSQTQAVSTASTERQEDELRLVTYNILAEPFATSEQAYTTLYPYCDQEVLQSEYRIQRILAELLACDADIVCLQECDLRTFEAYLLPILGRRGYSGHFTCKGSTEGCAVFTLDSTCRVVQRVDLPLKNVLRDAPHLSNLYLQRPDLQDIIGGKLGTVAQITVLQSTRRPQQAIVVANTHLFYHPLASFLRTIQAYAITEALGAIQSAIETNGLQQDFISLVNGEETNQLALDKESRLAKCLLSSRQVDRTDLDSTTNVAQTQQDKVKATVMLLGDLNSSPNIAALQFLTNGFATEEQLNYVWEEVKHFFWGDREANFNFTNIHDHKEKRRKAEEEKRQAQKERNTDGTKNDNIEELSEKLEELNLYLDSAGLQPVMTHRLGLMSAAGFAPYSNYTPTFKQLLDYILVQERDFEVVRVAPMPSEEVFGEFEALPSAVIPSDHVAIAVDLRWK